MVFMIEVLEKVKVNKNMQKYWGLIVYPFFPSSFDCYLSIITWESSSQHIAEAQNAPAK